MRLETKQKLKLELIKNWSLSVKEIEVFFLVGSGLLNREVAIDLSVTESTIKFHLCKIFKKIKIKNRYQLILIANGIKLLQPNI